MTSLSRASLIRRFWDNITPRRHKQIGWLLVLMLLGSFAEMLSIGAVMPFLAILTQPEQVFAHPVAQPLIHALGMTEPKQLLFPLSIGFCVFVLTASILRWFLLWASTRLSFALGADIGISMYQTTLHQPYAVHIARNSSEIISGISAKGSHVIYGIILPVLALISASVMSITIVVTLLMINPLVALLTFGGFGSIYMLVIRLTHDRVIADGQSIAKESNQVIKVLQEGLGGIRDILIDGSQAAYCRIFSKADQSLRRAQGNSVIISGSPRIAIEMLGMLMVITLAYTLASRPGGILGALPILGAFTIGALRMLPMLQQAYAAWTSIQSGRAAFEDVLDLLDQPMVDNTNLPVAQSLNFNKCISVNNLGFSYNSQTPDILKNIDLTFAKGSRVGFVGVTGSGKSTLLDIIMGLLQPTEGTLKVDGQVINSLNNRAWQTHIAHVPQTIFLADASIEENIAFGLPKNKIDGGRVRLAAKQARIADIIETWPERYETSVGERGVRLSGGQRQRIGIARALYKQADVIIFDEATSALDNETEHAVMNTIENLSKDLTLLIIAHRLTTLKNCTHIVELSGGEIKRIGSYQEIVGRSV